ncbi:MAG: peptide-methionine (S)-S-oxide reductase MsrA [Thermoanaerobaculia bacterium]
MKKFVLLNLIVIAFAACGNARTPESAGGKPAHLAVATFSGGCFWCMEKPFDQTAGVVDTTSGYTGGDVVRPSYEEVSGGGTGHRESERVTYDPTKVSYEQLLDVYWHNVDPFDAGGQFCDRGSQYTTAIWYHDENQRRLAEASKQRIEQKFGKKVYTAILPAGAFYPAEDYHQNFYQKNPIRYEFYRHGCGRDRRLEEIWGK